jgi:hypothetical protein
LKIVVMRVMIMQWTCWLESFHIWFGHLFDKMRDGGEHKLFRLFVHDSKTFYWKIIFFLYMKNQIW